VTGIVAKLAWRTSSVVAVAGFSIEKRTVSGHDAPATGTPVALTNADALVFTRWVLVMTHFERELYADPDADLDAIWWSLVNRYQLLTPPDGRRAPDWAAKIHIACAPVYYHTYLYGHLVAAQLRAAIRREVGGLANLLSAHRDLANPVHRAEVYEAIRRANTSAVADSTTVATIVTRLRDDTNAS